jgi:hypothetical protein
MRWISIVLCEYEVDNRWINIDMCVLYVESTLSYVADGEIVHDHVYMKG